MIIDFNPIALDIGFLQIHWYGVMYLLAFVSAYWIAIYRTKTLEYWIPEQVTDLIFYGAIGVVVGGRIGYMLFYSFNSVLEDPLSLFKIWQGGMSFHGGAIGVVVGGYFFAKKYQKKFLDVIDFIVPLIPAGLAFGRFGNFINGELWGKPTDLPWGMQFITDQSQQIRHPSMLYEMFFEGIVIFFIIRFFIKSPKPTGAVTGLGLLLYGVFRFLVEFVRVPDAHLGYLAWGWLTMGQVLTFPIIIIGALLLIFSYVKNETIS